MATTATTIAPQLLQPLPLFQFPVGTVNVLTENATVPAGQNFPNPEDITQWTQLFTNLKNDLTQKSTSSQKRVKLINIVQKVLIVLSLGAIVAAGFGSSLGLFCAVGVVALAANLYTCYKQRQWKKIVDTTGYNLTAATQYLSKIQTPEFLAWMNAQIPHLLNKPMDPYLMNAALYTFCDKVEQVKLDAETKKNLLTWHQEWAQHPLNTPNTIVMPGHPAPINKMGVKATDLNAWKNYVQTEAIQVQNREAQVKSKTKCWNIFLWTVYAVSSVALICFALTNPGTNPIFFALGGYVALNLTSVFIYARNMKKIQKLKSAEEDCYFRILEDALKDPKFPQWMQDNQLDDRLMFPVEFSHCANHFNQDRMLKGLTGAMNFYSTILNPQPQQPAQPAPVT